MMVRRSRKLRACPPRSPRCLHISYTFRRREFTALMMMAALRPPLASGVYTRPQSTYTFKLLALEKLELSKKNLVF